MGALGLDAEALVTPKRALVSLCSQSCGWEPWIPRAWIFWDSGNLLVYPRPAVSSEKEKKKSKKSFANGS